MQRYPTIIHHGGHEGVTGSCHELRLSADSGLLIDCGLFQGAEEGSSARDEESPHRIDFPVAHLRALILTHAHIDHAGRIPWLLAAGYAGPILCSEPTALLLPLILEDAFRVGVSRDTRLLNRYLEELGRRLTPVPYGRWQDMSAGVRLRLQPAGHILGSAYVEIEAGGVRYVFSGDLGAPYSPLLPAPKAPYRADVLVLEATYGDRLHKGRRERRAQLQAILERALADRGAVLVPAFALGRTQELLYELEEIIHGNRQRFAAQGLPWEELEVVLDAPLGQRITEAFRQLQPFWDAEALKRVRQGRRPLAFEQLTVVESHADHEHAVRQLQRHGRPCIVIAGGGMCGGGRIVNYLKALLADTRTDVLFIGYQAQGTPGRAIQQYGPRGGYVVLDGQRIDIRARVHSLSGYSAHADQKNLIDFVRRMRKKPRKIRLVHGEDEARLALAAALRQVVAVEVK